MTKQRVWSWGGMAGGGLLIEVELWGLVERKCMWLLVSYNWIWGDLRKFEKRWTSTNALLIYSKQNACMRKTFATSVKKPKKSSWKSPMSSLWEVLSPSAETSTDNSTTCLNSSGQVTLKTLRRRHRQNLLHLHRRLRWSGLSLSWNIWVPSLSESQVSRPHNFAEG